jgi:hypothetical protein
VRWQEVITGEPAFTPPDAFGRPLALVWAYRDQNSLTQGSILVNDMMFDGYFRVDETAVTLVPEPGSLGLLAPGMFTFLRRRRQAGFPPVGAMSGPAPARFQRNGRTAGTASNRAACRRRAVRIGLSPWRRSRRMQKQRRKHPLSHRVAVARQLQLVGVKTSALPFFPMSAPSSIEPVENLTTAKVYASRHARQEATPNQWIEFLSKTTETLSSARRRWATRLRDYSRNAAENSDEWAESHLLIISIIGAGVGVTLGVTLGGFLALP